MDGLQGITGAENKLKVFGRLADTLLAKQILGRVEEVVHHRGAAFLRRARPEHEHRSGHRAILGLHPALTDAPLAQVRVRAG